MSETFKLELPEDVADEQMVLPRERVSAFVKGCQNSIRLAVELKRGNVTKEVMDVLGMSAAKNRIMLNHLLSYPKARYLEVGVFAGANFCAALHGNNPEYACAIDNFSQPDLMGGRVDEKFFKANADKFVDCKYDFFNRDCFDLTKTQKKKLTDARINIYNYDGPHSEEDHFKAITEYHDFLDDVFIIIVDDWNLPQVRTGTFKGLKAKNVNVQWQIDLKATGSKDKENWWNGVWVAVCVKRK
jgi:hypothetical protein